MVLPQRQHRRPRKCQTCGTNMVKGKNRRRDQHEFLTCPHCQPMNRPHWSSYQDVPAQYLDEFVAREAEALDSIEAVLERQAGIMDYYDVVVLHRGDEAPMREYGSPGLGDACDHAQDIWMREQPIMCAVVNRGNGTTFWRDGDNTMDGRFTSSKSAARAQASEIKEGDLIQLSSGGPPLLVKKVATPVMLRDHVAFTFHDGSTWTGSTDARLSTLTWDDVDALRTSSTDDDLTLTVKLAHDYGDGATLAHCPICGSGAITGRSDGTVECNFCNTAFSVQIQPTQPAMPQTVDGQPYQAPDLPTAPGTDLSSPVDLSTTAPADSAVQALYVAPSGIAVGEDEFVASMAAKIRDDEVQARLAARQSAYGRR